MLYGYRCCMQWIKILYTDITVYKKKTDDINKDIAEDVEKRFGTSKLWIRMPILVKGRLY